MPEPITLAIAVACTSLISNIVTLSKQIVTFVSDFRDARKDMDAVSRELSSLSLCLEGLRNDSSKIQLPTSLQQNLVGVLRNCDDVTKEMRELLRKLSSENLGRRMQWSIIARDEMNKLRSRLEAHKSAIDIALDMISMYVFPLHSHIFLCFNHIKHINGRISGNQLTATSFLVNSVKKDTRAIRNDVADIKQNTSQIATLVHEIGLLRLHVSQLEGRGGSGGVLLERFLAESTTYAESVIDIEDSKAIAPEQNPTLTLQEEGNGSDWDSPWTSDDLDEQHHAPVPQPTQSPENMSRSPVPEPVSVPPVQWPSPNRGAHFRSCSDVPRTTRPIALPKVDSLWGSLQEKTKKGKRQSETLHLEAIKVVATKAREKLSQSKREQLDNKLLLLLGDIQNSRWASLRGKEHRSAKGSAKIGTQEEVRDVLDRGADPNARARGDRSAENEGCTGLLIEIKNAGRIEVVRLLLSRGADVNTTGGFYGNALQMATAYPREERHKNELLKTLLAYGADINAQGGYYGNALQGAAFRGDLGAVELLLEHGADVNARGGFYESALQAASVKGNVNIIRFLLKHGADINAQGGEFGNTLQAAAYWSNLETVELLLEHGADINAQGGSYGSALQAASAKGHVEVVHFLLEHGADINRRGGCYGSALQAASTYCHSSVVRLLLNHGADVNARGGKHGLALQAAFSNSSAPLGKREMTVKLLREHQATE